MKAMSSFCYFCSLSEELYNGLDNNPKLQNLQNRKHLKQVLNKNAKLVAKA